MPFSHHTHSGQFCPGHAKNTLEEILLTAIDKRMEVFAFSEHMPRHDQDQYPEEILDGWTLERHVQNQFAYYSEALRLRAKYGSRISILVGFEGEWIRPESKDLILQSLSAHSFDFFIGSVHHVHTIPIDWDLATYQKVRDIAGGTDERLFEDYFDAQFDMMQQLKPPVIGHLDLIRLKSNDPDRSFQLMSVVWQKVLRNLNFAAGYGALLEINTAALRKGMKEPYPMAEICKEYLSRGGRFCLSDDSHGIDQVATNYEKTPNFFEQAGIQELYSLAYAEMPVDDPFDERFPHTRLIRHTLHEIRTSHFWILRAGR